MTITKGKMNKVADQCGNKKAAMMVTTTVATRGVKMSSLTVAV